MIGSLDINYVLERAGTPAALASRRTARQTPARDIDPHEWVRITIRAQVGGYPAIIRGEVSRYWTARHQIEHLIAAAEKRLALARTLIDRTPTEPPAPPRLRTHGAQCHDNVRIMAAWHMDLAAWHRRYTCLVPPATVPRTS